MKKFIINKTDDSTCKKADLFIKNHFAFLCGFSHHIAGIIITAQESSLVSVLCFFAYFFLLQLVAKGGDTLNTSSFQQIIRLQFDSLMKLVIRRKSISYYRELARHSKHEKPFCDLLDISYENGINDLYPSEYMTFYVYDFIVQMSNEKLGKALKKLSNRQIDVILLFYFFDFSDIEIAKLYQCSRSAIYRSRKNALNKLKIQMKGKQA